MKKIQLILLLLLLMIPMGVKGASCSSCKKFSCHYTYSDDASKHYYLIRVDLYNQNDSNFYHTSSDPQDMAVDVTVWEDGVKVWKNGENSTNTNKTYDVPLYSLSNFLSRSEDIPGTGIGTQYEWQDFVKKYALGPNKEFDSGEEAKNYQTPVQECPEEIYIIRMESNTGLRQFFSVKSNPKNSVGIAGAPNLSNALSSIVAKRLSPPNTKNCIYGGTLEVGTVDSAKEHSAFYKEVSLKLTPKILQNPTYDSTTHTYSGWTSEYYYSTIGYIWAKAKCETNSKYKNCPSESVLKKQYYNFGNGESYYKLLVTNTKSTFLDCPMNVATELTSSWETEESPLLLFGKDCQRDTLNCLSLNKTEESGDPGSYTPKPHPYDNVEVCDDKTYSYINGCGCMPASLTDLTSRMYLLLKIAAPALLLIIGGFEMVKAMTAADESAIKKAQQKLIKKVVAAAAVFILLTAIQLLASVLGADADAIQCLDYLLNGYNV